MHHTFIGNDFGVAPKINFTMIPLLLTFYCKNDKNKCASFKLKPNFGLFPYLYQLILFRRE